jgi:hypothetical protein
MPAKSPIVFRRCLGCGYASHRRRGERYCIHCGTVLASRCRQCASPFLHPWAEHCPFCGRKLVDDPKPAAAEVLMPGEETSP